MPLLLTRIDDRLIHGQVVVGWCRRLRPDRIVLCHDRIAADPWQREVYASSVPPQLAVSILDRAATVRLLGDGAAEGRLLLVEGPGDLLDLLARGVELEEVNLGGMHARHGKYELLPYIHLDAADLADLRQLLVRGVRLFAQSVPGAPRIEIDSRRLDELEVGA